MRLTLGGLIDLLTNRPDDQRVWFDFGGLSPTTIDSYRGYYEDAALGFSQETDPTVPQVLAELRGAIGKVVTGYKGGDFELHRNSRLWVANYGRTSDTAIVGVEECDYTTILRTEWCES